ncbi:DUF2304 domain-containing protein [Pseudonocardia phyllosphaerae]|uniref:DUF2304 domain-containing protein n=1 Tax=Pseudonocardia phyllosphaerae TaxID=3390502 RepID=UPI00397AE354
MTLQIILVLAALGALAYFVRSGQTVGVRASKRLAFFGFVLLNIYAVLRPDDVTMVARLLGIGRGTDLIVYLLVVALLFATLNSYLRDREISQHLTNLARQVAVRDAELDRREQELAERLEAVERRLHDGGSVPVTDVRQNGSPVAAPVDPNGSSHS